MNVLELVGSSEFKFKERDTPQPGEGEVRITVYSCGICGSDLHGMDGSSGRRIPPVVMGHEASGVVDEVGEGVTDWKKGDRVTFDSTVWCGECHFCKQGRVNLCESRQVVGVSCDEFHRDGAFAEYVVVPSRIVHRLPNGLSFEEAAFAEPVGVALHAVSRAGDLTGRRALVVGAGLIGLLILQALKRAGAAQVDVVDLSEDRLALAQKLGAGSAAKPTDFSKKDYDVVMEVVGVASTIELALNSAVKGGKVVLVGNLSPEVPLPLQIVVTRELDVLGSCAIAGEYPEALEAIASGEIQVRPLISGIFPLEKGVEAFEEAGRQGALKIIVSPKA